MLTADNSITARQLRQALVQLDNQQMTVEELRRKLFEIDDQDKPVEIEPYMWRKLGIE